LPVEVLSALFRRLFLKMLLTAHHAGQLQFFGDHVRLAHKAVFKAYLTPLREIDWWVVYAKEPFAGPAHRQSARTTCGRRGHPALLTLAIRQTDRSHRHPPNLTKPYPVAQSP
jgi:hypothetical protein